MLPSAKIYCSSSLIDLENRISIYERYQTDLKGKAERSRGIHFFLGDPPLLPPTVRGSVLLRLTPKFLLDNITHFIVGRPIDLDGVRFGHLPRLPIELPIDKVEFNSKKFLEVCSLLTKLEPEEWHRFSSERASEQALELLKDVLPTSMIEYMRTTKSFHARAFEYELSENFILKASHVLSLHIPKPFAQSTVGNKLALQLGARVKLYNPKYGLEAARA